MGEKGRDQRRRKRRDPEASRARKTKMLCSLDVVSGLCRVVVAEAQAIKPPKAKGHHHS